MRLKDFAGLIVVVLLIGIISAETCRIMDVSSFGNKCPSGWNKVMGLSSSTNAHAENYNSDIYSYALCCNFAGTNVCNGDNKIIGLSSSTNAHAEIPEQSNYTGNDVCFGNFNCTSRSACSGEMEILSVSDLTNAHLSNFSGVGSYSEKICCNPCPEGQEYDGITCTAPTISFFSDDKATAIIGRRFVSPGITEVYLILDNFNSDTSYTLNLYDDDTTDDDFIRSFTGTSDSFGSLDKSWLITEEDLEEGRVCVLGVCNEDIEELEFFFNISGTNEKSINTLKVNVTDCVGINLCMDYKDESLCEDDPCMRAEISVESDNSQLSCGAKKIEALTNCEIWDSCGCEWKDDACVPKVTHNRKNCPSNPNLTGEGSCLFIEDVSDDCSDEILTFSWLGDWTWNYKNNFSSKASCESQSSTGSCINDSSNIWHLDPLKKSISCINGGSNSIACPSQIQLPFFTMGTFLVTLVIIGVIYYIWNIQKKKAKSKIYKRRKQ